MKWALAAVALVACVVIIAVVFRAPQDQDAQVPPKETPGSPSTPPVSSVAPKPENPTTRDAGSGTPAEAAGAVKAFEDFAASLGKADYEQAWKLTSRYFQTNEYVGFAAFKEAMTAQGALLAACTVQPGSAKKEGEHVRLLVKSKDAPVDLYMYYVDEDGQWKLHHAQEARDVDASSK